MVKTLCKVCTGNVADSSSAGALDKTDWAKLARNAGLAGVAAVVTYLAVNVNLIDFGQYNVLVVPLLHTIFDGLLKFIKDNEG